jgi:hypothetical protein
MSEAFPSAEGKTATEQGVTEELRVQLTNPYADAARA